MSALVLPLTDSRITVENAGGKGASLARLLSAGLPVPRGFLLTTEAYWRFVGENGIQDRIAQALAGFDPADPASLEAASRHICGAFAQGRIPPEIVAAVSAAYEALNGVPVAVRSSATAEDLPGASFAGQQETYLNVRGTEAVLQAVKKCWASLWAARAIAYRLKNQIDQATVALAVVVQELACADAAGVMFTANPASGNRGELVISAAWGLGEAVVSGAVTPDTIVVSKATGRVVSRQTAEKLVMTVRTEQGTGQRAVPSALQKRAVLSKAQAEELARLGVTIEQLYEAPMDIEWALAGGRFSIVQARPITALPPEWKSPDPRALQTRGSLAEHTPSPATPLFATLGLEIANEATARVWQRMVGNDAHKLIPDGGVYQTINGHVYLGIRMGGTSALRVLRMTISQLGPVLRGSVARWRAARREFAAVVDAWERQPVESLSPSHLLEGVRTVFGAACRYYTEVQTTLPAASTSELLFTKLYDGLIRRRGDPSAATFLLGLDTAALRAEKSLFDIAAWVRTQPALASYASQVPTGDLETDLQHETPPEGLPEGLWREWRVRLRRHLEEFGRTAYEFDFAHLTPQETPGPMLDAIKAYLAGSAPNPYEREREAAARREQATQAVLARVRWPLRGWFLKLLRWAQDTGPMREDSIFDMGMGHPLLRRMLAELGRRFAAAGAIAQAGDIYWLEKAEVEALVAALEGGAPLPNLAGAIPARKEQWKKQLELVPPVMLPEKSGWSRLVGGGEARKRGGRVVLKGVGTSGGVVTAPACVLLGPEDLSKLKAGDVLVAVTTTPAWTPLFLLASAVVTDIGGPLSHSSIIAREYGIPAVMATRTATRAIRSGQIITVDGNAGTVTLEG